MNRSDFMCIDQTLFGCDANQAFVQDAARCRTLVHTAMHDAESACSPGQHVNFAPSMESAFKAPFKFGRSISNCMSRESCTNRTHLPEWWCHVQSTCSGSHCTMHTSLSGEIIPTSPYSYEIAAKAL